MQDLKQITFDFDATPEPPVPENPLPAAAIHPLVKKRGRKPKPAPLIAKEPSKRGRLSLKETDAAAENIDIPDDEILFQKRYYSIGQVAEMFHVNHSLLRMWSNEFDDYLQTKKNKKGDRYFRPEDVKNLKLIYQLLRERKYTIEGAKDFLKKNKNAEEKFAMTESLKKIKAFLNELKANL